MSIFDTLPTAPRPTAAQNPTGIPYQPATGTAGNYAQQVAQAGGSNYNIGSIQALTNYDQGHTALPGINSTFQRLNDAGLVQHGVNGTKDSSLVHYDPQYGWVTPASNIAPESDGWGGTLGKVGVAAAFALGGGAALGAFGSGAAGVGAGTAAGTGEAAGGLLGGAATGAGGTAAGVASGGIGAGGGSLASWGTEGGGAFAGGGAWDGAAAAANGIGAGSLDYGTNAYGSAYGAEYGTGNLGGDALTADFGGSGSGSLWQGAKDLYGNKYVNNPLTRKLAGGLLTGNQGGQGPGYQNGGPRVDSNGNYDWAGLIGPALGSLATSGIIGSSGKANRFDDQTQASIDAQRGLLGQQGSIGTDMASQYKSVYQPLENQFASNAFNKPIGPNYEGLNYLDPTARVNEARTGAFADSQQALDSARGQTARTLGRYGVNPNSGKFSGAMDNQSLQGAANIAGNVNNAGRQTRDLVENKNLAIAQQRRGEQEYADSTNFNRQSNVVNLGRNAENSAANILGNAGVGQYRLSALSAQQAEAQRNRDLRASQGTGQLIGGLLGGGYDAYGNRTGSPLGGLINSGINSAGNWLTNGFSGNGWGGGGGGTIMDYSGTGQDSLQNWGTDAFGAGGAWGDAGSLWDGGDATNLAFKAGGPVKGRGTETSDSIPAHLSNNEFVVNAPAARLLNAQHPGMLQSANQAGAMAQQAGHGIPVAPPGLGQPLRVAPRLPLPRETPVPPLPTTAQKGPITVGEPPNRPGTQIHMMNVMRPGVLPTVNTMAQHAGRGLPRRSA